MLENFNTFPKNTNGRRKMFFFCIFRLQYFGFSLDKKIAFFNIFETQLQLKIVPLRS